MSIHTATSRRRASSNPMSVLLLLIVLLVSTAGLGESSQNNNNNDEEPTCSVEDREECADDNSNGMTQTAQKVHQFREFLSHMFDTIDAHAASLRKKPNLREQEHLILTTWLTWLDSSTANTRDDDPATMITQSPLQTNWLYDIIYQRTHDELAPSIFFKVWDERARPTKEEIRLLLQLDDSAYQAALTPTDENGGEERLDENVLMNHLFLPFRHRGFTATLLDTFCRVLLGPLKTIAYAIPSPSNLELLSQYSPLIEVGAGTGYWSAALQLQYGRESITPYDSHPPSSPTNSSNDNENDPNASLYFDRTYTKVHQGDCQSLFGGQDNNNNGNNNNHTLLMVWPNNPDNVDNAPEFHSPRLPPVWDAECVRSFVARGGTHVILVAERETNIHVLPHRPEQGSPTWPDSGLCATRELQTLLQQEFDLIHQMEVPTWYYSDDLTVWKKKEAVATNA